MLFSSREGYVCACEVQDDVVLKHTYNHFYYQVDCQGE